MCADGGLKEDVLLTRAGLVLSHSLSHRFSLRFSLSPYRQYPTIVQHGYWWHSADDVDAFEQARVRALRHSSQTAHAKRVPIQSLNGRCVKRV